MATVSIKYSAKQMKLAHELASYKNKWVAIARVGSVDKVVASGDRITEAKEAAEKKGYKDPTFRKIPSEGKILIAINQLNWGGILDA